VRKGATDGPARLTVIARGERVRHAVVIRRAPKIAPRSGDWSRVPYVWCTGVGFTASVDNTMRFGAAWGETVWWRPIGLELRNGRYTWRLGDRWTSYRAHPGDGQYLYDAATGQIETAWTVVQSMPLTVSAYGTSIRPAIQVYTQRGGYEWAFIGATYIQGYAEQATNWCYVPNP
jgi:hypothetical protein